MYVCVFTKKQVLPQGKEKIHHLHTLHGGFPKHFNRRRVLINVEVETSFEFLGCLGSIPIMLAFLGLPNSESQSSANIRHLSEVKKAGSLSGFLPEIVLSEPTPGDHQKHQ